MPFPFGLKPYGQVSVEVGGRRHVAEYRSLKGRMIGGRFIPHAVVIWSPEIGKHEGLRGCKCPPPCACARVRAEAMLLAATMPRREPEDRASVVMQTTLRVNVP